MREGFSAVRYQEAEQELTRMEAYLLELAQEIYDTTAPGSRYNHTWLQVDSTISYIRSLRGALQRENAVRPHRSNVS